MAKDDFDLEGLDWPDLDFGETQEPSNDRNPVEKVTKQAAKGAVKGLADETVIRRTVTKVLPKGHSDAADLAFQIKDLVGETGRNLGGEAAKTKQELQRSLRNFNRQTKGLFKDDSRVAKILKKLAGEDPSYYGSESEEEKRQKEVQNTLLEVFGEQAEARNEEKQQAASKELRNEVLRQRRFGTQLQVLTSIDTGIRKINDHNDVGMRFMRKQLQLQLQGNLMQADLIEQIGGLRKDMVEELKAVVKNTALPEAAKIELTEEFKRVNTQRALEKIGGSVFGGLSDYAARTGANINKRLMNTIGGKLRELRSNVSGGLDAAGELVRMQLDARAEGGEDDTVESIVQMASGLLMDKATNRWGGKIRDRLAKTKLFGGSSGKVDNYMSQGARLLNWQAGLRGDHDGLKGQALDFFRSLLDRTTLNGSTKGFTGFGDLDHDDPKMKRLGLKTIIHIIPGLLARIHHEAVMSRTGDDTVPMIRFNADTGTFTDSKSVTKVVRDKLIGQGTGAINTEAMDKVMSNVVDTSKMTQSQKTMLRNHLAHLNMRQIPFDPKAIAMGRMQIFGEGSSEDRSAVRKLIAQQYGVSYTGDIEGNLDNYHQRVADSAKSIQSMRFNLKDPRKEILELIESGNTEELVALGVLKEQHGQLVIDFDRVNEMRFNDQLGDGAYTGRGGYSPAGFRKLGGKGGKTINHILNTSTSSSVTNMTSIRGTGSGLNKEDRYNSEYQSMALEEIIDVLKQGQTLSEKHMESLNAAIRDINQDPQGERYNAEYQTMVLEEIMDILQDGRQFTNIGEGGAQPGLLTRGKQALGRLRGKIGDRFNSLKSAIKGTSLMGMATGLKNRIMGRYQRNRDWVKDKYASVRDRVKDTFQDIQDWYREGEWRPALEQRKLAAKKYIDEKTGKVVEKLRDVKGDILELLDNGKTRVAVFYEDLVNGLRNGEGRKFFAKKYGQLKGLINAGLDRVLGRHAALKDKLVDKAKGAIGWTKSTLWGMPDVYVKGEDKPRLLAVLAKGGNYITIGGNEVRTVNDIKGPVADRVGNVILSLDDIAKGLVDADGNDLSRFAPGLRGILQRITSIPGALKEKLKGAFGFKGVKRKVKRGMVRVRRAFRGLGKMLSGLTGGIMGGLRNAWSAITSQSSTDEEELLNVAYAQLEVQGQILDQIVGLRKKKKRGKWDSDGDGIIDGSWRDLLARRKKKGEEGTGKDGKPDMERKKGPLMEMLSSVFGKGLSFVGGAIKGLGEIFWDAIKWLGGIIAAKTGMDKLFRRGRNPGGRTPAGKPGRTPRPRGKFGMLLGGLTTALGFSGLALGDDNSDMAMDMVDNLDAARTSTTQPKGKPKTSRFNWKSLKNSRNLLRMGGQALRAGGWRAMLNPWVLAGTAVVGSYLWYDSRKKRPLRDARLLHYGVNLAKEEQADKYLEFENWVLENGNNAEPEKILEAMEDILGGIRNNTDISLRWYVQRFKPVFAKWQEMAKSFDKLKSFNDLDDVLTVNQAYSGFLQVKPIIDEVTGVDLAGTDRAMHSGAARARLVEIEAQLKEAAGGVEADASDSKSSWIAGSRNALAVLKGDKELLGVGGFADKFHGFAVDVIPGGKFVKGTFGFLKGYYEQATGGSAGRDFEKIRVGNDPLDPLRSVRMKVYGLSKLEQSHVNALLKLEVALVKDFTYSGKSTAVYRGDAKAAMEACAATLGVGSNDSQSMGQFYQWFERRFLPAFSTYLGAAKQAGINDPLMAHKSASLTKQYYVANEMVAATTMVGGDVISVWKTGLSPLPGRAPNGDPGSVIGNMEAMLAKVDNHELSEISGEKGGILTSAAKKVSGWMSKVTEFKNDVIQGATSWMSDSWKSRVRGFFGADVPSLSSGPAPSLPHLSTNVPGGSYTPSIGTGQQVNFDPAGGKYGNVADIPMPTGRKGFEHHMALIKAVAEMTGIDPGILAGLFATESSFDSTVKAGTSSAKGLGQFIDKTWESMVKQYGHLFGIKPGTSPNDPRANALMTVMYMKHNAEEIKKKTGKKDITDVDLYLAHFLGAHGYSKLYKNPNARAADLLPDSAASNASIFYVDGDTRRPRTAAEVLQIQANKQIRNRNHYAPLMYAYIKENGGTVPNEALASGGMTVDGNTLGGSEVPQTASANTGDAQEDIMNTPSTSGFKPSMLLNVDAGGVPNDTGAVKSTTAATAVTTAAKAGSDVAVPPSTTSPAGITPVKQEPTPMPQQTSSITPDPKAPGELVSIGNNQVSLLQAIQQGIDALVKLSVSNAQQARPVNGRLPPMMVSKPSSV